MSICVDPLIKWTAGHYGVTGSVLTQGKTCHLFTDDGDLVALHKLATSIGLRREWFQDNNFPHYDLVPSKRVLAVAAGAFEVDRRYSIWIRKRGGK